MDLSAFGVFLKKLFFAFFVLSAVVSPGLAADEPDAKSIPKPMLMLGLYCNTAMASLKERFEKNPLALPWRADGKKKESILDVMQKLDLNDSGYAKAIRDNAITANEAQFLKLSAVHEASRWMINISHACANPDRPANDYETCLKESNTEIYKCYLQILDRAKMFNK
jgi:hypothetical protein